MEKTALEAALEKAASKKIEKELIAGMRRVVEADIADGKYNNWRPVPKPPLGKIVRLDNE